MYDFDVAKVSGTEEHTKPQLFKKELFGVKKQDYCSTDTR